MFPSNKLVNTKYNVFTFIPVVLYNQFKFFFNLFFLLICLSQLFPALKVGFLFTYVAPLAFVLVVTLLKEAWDDIQRYQRDKELNNRPLEKLTISGAMTTVTSANLRVGDIIKVSHNERVPADLLLLYTTEKSASVFIRTDQLDGETDWKLRKSVSLTQQQALSPEGLPSLVSMDAHIVANPPTDLIYDFKGYFQAGNEFDVLRSQREGLSLENTLWANTVLASTGYIMGMVLYTGKETRSMMNARDAATKVGKLDLELNRLSKLLFVFMLCVSLAVVAMDEFRGRWIIKFFRFVLLLSYIIPISLRVNLDMAKIYYSYCIYRDDEIEGTIPRNSTIPEELGRIQYLLTDKTGTLTKNDMVFKKLAMEYAQFDLENLPDLKSMLDENCLKHNGPMGDLVAAMQLENQLTYSLNTESNSGGGANNKKGRKNPKRREQHYMVRDLVTCLALCHNVTPTYPDPSDLSIREFQASSPDEVALVKFSDTLGLKLLERDQQKIVIQNTAGVVEEYHVLANFPFSSETKRMGIVLRHVQSQRLIFYLKGAETVMKNKVKPSQRVTIDESCENLANEGLRTLVISQKLIEESYFQDWQRRYAEAKADMGNREASINAVVNELEQEMELLGVTGVEDKLQDEVALTIESLRGAGIQVWMLTGDKVETATCIAMSAGFKSRHQQLFFMRDLTSVKECEQVLKEFQTKDPEKYILMIDGQTIDIFMTNKSLDEQFFGVATLCPSVCVCRCSPTQKALIVKKIGHYTKKRTASVGDGGNDVGMILEANVGIGIVGKEGKQASLASDFSINQFSYLRRLILWHGRLSYKRSAVLSQFVIHRGLIISVMQAIFSIIFYFVAIPVYNGLLMLGYSSIYTNLPVFSLVFDQDVPVHAVMKFPPLYKTLQKGRSLSTKTFLIWLWKSIFQGCVIMLASVMFFNEPFTNIVTITFSALIVIELLNVYSEINKPNWKMIVSSVLTFVIYILSIALLREYFDTSYITWAFVVKVLLITVLSWLPLHLTKWLIYKIDPTEQQKILNQEKLH
ncbi:hypothetical protein FGO68_gene5532 [Halteria grandinella]|uniref:Phospholipid-transporting ATPase n=1 Tax=Halteria grandinella TaxID=5974 RepID=A0A8J8T8G1_HALGN|nr:hypothetical protein FGO68_gene5532 [Halteria grandinella]